MRRQKIHLGYSIPDGKPVEIPLNHMVVVGQTQMAGKTTALEALIGRSELRALTFITKRGEGSFQVAHRLDPYFQERADWKFVSSILEASRGEKLKFERAWIIRASKGAKTLADVQRNVRKQLETAKGLAGDVYLVLDAYLDDVVPQIAKIKWATSIKLEAGVNVMDLTGLKTEMQHLVIRSSLDWVHEYEKDTVVVIPEAWKFIPQGRGSPVRLSAESYIRQGGGLRNFMWLDSQDIAGVEKLILKSCPVWLLGVQREANEIKRTLNNIPADIKKPKASQIARLSLGEFYACWEKETVLVYAQPFWMESDLAVRVAKGDLSAERAGEIAQEKYDSDLPFPAPDFQAPVWLDEPLPDMEDDDMSAAGEARIIEGLDRISNQLDEHDRRHQEGLEAIVSGGKLPEANTPEAKAIAGAVVDGEAMYQEFKRRFIKEIPAIIKLYNLKPEIRVEEQRTILEAGDDLQGWLIRLISEGFFDEGANANVAYVELKRRGKKLATNLPVYKAMDALTALGAVTKEKSGKNVRYVKNPDLVVTKAK